MRMAKTTETINGKYAVELRFQEIDSKNGFGSHRDEVEDIMAKIDHLQLNSHGGLATVRFVMPPTAQEQAQPPKSFAVRQQEVTGNKNSDRFDMPGQETASVSVTQGEGLQLQVMNCIAQGVASGWDSQMKGTIAMLKLALSGESIGESSLMRVTAQLTEASQRYQNTGSGKER